MARISKRELGKKEFEELFGHFVSYIHKLESCGEKKRFFRQFFGEEEKIMLAKRLAMIVLLEKGVSPYEVWQKLGVSSSTVMRIATRLDRGGYRGITKSVKRKSSDLDELIKFFIYAGGLMPPRVGSRSEWRKYRKEKLGF